MRRDWHGWAIYFVTILGGHDPYAVLHRWPLTLTLDTFLDLQLRGALEAESRDDRVRNRKLAEVGA